MKEKLRALLEDPRCVKALATVGEAGAPHVVYKDSMRLDADGNLEFYEMVETSQTGRNLVHCLWYGKEVAVNLLGSGGESLQIKGVPVRAVVCGDAFEAAYVKLRERYGGDADLSAIWTVEVREVRGNGLAHRLARQRERFPLIGHIDRFVDRERIGE
ncbi:MAG: pyridoxamine 5'-phosphate oxidase family protein [Clostridiales Family XIII bacterium]|jgi:hypothetical protein|nr:pyridoxamine 5'-phosphate oxidase family protein [Clostridiales Family XIII bacterium]